MKISDSITDEDLERTISDSDLDAFVEALGGHLPTAEDARDLPPEMHQQLDAATRRQWRRWIGRRAEDGYSRPIPDDARHSLDEFKARPAARASTARL